MATFPIQLLYISALLCTGEPKPVELKARTWINAPSIRVPDDRQYVLFFFSTVQDRDVGKFIKVLNQIHARPDTVVIGLTPESTERVEKFVEKNKPRFPVGAGSRSYRGFSIKRFPQLIVLDPRARGDQPDRLAADLESLYEWFPALPEDVSVDSGTFDQDSSVGVLKHRAQEDIVEGERKRALRLLRTKLPADEFMGFCDKLLEKYTPADREYGYIEYQKHLADRSIVDKEPLLAPSTLASREERENPKDPKWDRMHRYFDSVKNRTAEQLLADYFEYLTDSPGDLQVRKLIPRRLERIVREGLADREIVRGYLMRLLTEETDFAIRLRIVGGLLSLCDPGDLEAAEFLEGQLETESNMRVLRPMMEYTIRYLRTGEE